MDFKTKIIGTGSYLPPRIVKNSEIADQLETTDEWIQEKIGIIERRYVDDTESTSDLAYKACQNALENAGKSPQDVKAIIAATATPDHFAPGIGTLVQDKLGCDTIPAFDVRNTSPGFLFALDLADQLIQAGKYDCILVVGAEVHSTCLDMSKRGRLMSVIFGDGAGAVVVEKSKDENGILDLKLHSNGKYYDKLWCEAPGAKFHPFISQDLIDQGIAYPSMDGRFIFENAVKLMSEVSSQLLETHQLSSKDIDHVIPHQANLRIIKEIGKKFEIDQSKIGLTIQKYGNTSAASIPITLDEMNRNQKINSGDLILTMSFGSGFSWVSGLIRW
jgi:3-oxoacyl-[acyl-carrier-protein] synthase-3